jgi:hypothetical protein
VRCALQRDSSWVPGGMSAAPQSCPSSCAGHTCVCLPCRAPDGLAYECDVCYNATTGMRFWGFVNALINLQSLVTGQDSRLRDLRVQGYFYEMYKIEKNGSRTEIARSQTLPVEPVQTDVHVPGGVWFLNVSAVVCTGVGGFCSHSHKNWAWNRASRRVATHKGAPWGSYG